MADKFTWMHSGQIGAPQMNGATGSNGQMLQVLDACLISGFNPQTVTTTTKTETTVTLTFGVSHGYELLQIITVSGATDVALNGQHRVTAKTANTITIDATGVAVTTGTITTKVAPLDFESIFGNTDPLKRAYRSKDIQSSKTVLYLDMTIPASSGYNSTSPPKRAMVSMCEDMTTLGVQINSYTNVENSYDTKPNGKMLWYQCKAINRTTAVTDSTNRSWVLLGNGSVFYLFNEWRTFGTSTFPVRDFYAFGDAISFDGSINANDCVWIGSINDNDATNTAYATVGTEVGGNITTASDIKGYMTKGYDGAGGLKPLVLTSDGTNAVFISGAYGNALSATTTAIKDIVAFPLHILTTEGIRATLPAIKSIPQNLSGDTNAFDRLISSGSVLVSAHDSTGSNSGNANIGFYAIEIEG